MARLFPVLAYPIVSSDQRPRSEVETLIGSLPRGPLVIYDGVQHPSQLDSTTQILLSPGVPRSIPLIQEAERRHIPVWCDLDLLYPLYSSKPIAAVTGTDGKTTTSTLLAWILESHQRVALLGNMGVPIAASYDALFASDCIVFELSSFMLESTRRFRANVSTILNIAEDHTDRYATMQAYASAKRKIVAHARVGDVLVANGDDRAMADWDVSPAKQQLLSRRSQANAAAYEHAGELCVEGARWPVSACRIRGEHHITNL
jgi:UDP-N-acetylmuramoylalanine--D-glutamate ligase